MAIDRSIVIRGGGKGINYVFVFIFILTCGLLQCPEVKSLRILSLMATPSPSHHIFNRVLNLELVKRGHHVTVLSPDVEKEPPPGDQYREFIIENMYDKVFANFNLTEIVITKMNFISHSLFFYSWVNVITDVIMDSQAMRDIASLAKKEQFDLVIYEIIGMECMLGILKDLNYPPIIGISAFGHHPFTSWISTNLDNPSFIAPYISEFKYPLSFMQKIESDMFYCLNYFLYTWSHMPGQMERGRKIFGSDMPELLPILRNTSLILINENLAKDEPRPLSPDVITIGGMHLQKPKPLPKDLQQWLDKSKEGVIFFALGTNIRSDKIPKPALDNLMKAFSKCKERILWKLETQMDVPKNVKISKWLPQRDILGHPNVKLFISHGGGMSTNEAIYNGVPVLVMPFVVDQIKNGRILENKDMGLVIDLMTATSQEIFQKIRTIIDDPKYFRRAQEMKSIYRDEPLHPLDKTIYWIEYVARHRGARHLRLPSRDMYWYEIVLWDIYAVYLTILFASIYLIKRFFQCICGRFNKKEEIKLKKN